MFPKPYLLFYIAGGISFLSGIFRLYPVADPLRALSSFLFSVSFFILAYYQRHPQQGGTPRARALQLLPIIAAVLLMLWLQT